MLFSPLLAYRLELVRNASDSGQAGELSVEEIMTWRAVSRGSDIQWWREGERSQQGFSSQTLGIIGAQNSVCFKKGKLEPKLWEAQDTENNREPVY